MSLIPLFLWLTPRIINAHIVINNSMSEVIYLFMSASIQVKSLTNANTVVNDSLPLATVMIMNVDTLTKSLIGVTHVVCVITGNINLLSMRNQNTISSKLLR